MSPLSLVLLLVFLLTFTLMYNFLKQFIMANRYVKGVVCSLILVRAKWHWVGLLTHQSATMNPFMLLAILMTFILKAKCLRHLLMNSRGVKGVACSLMAACVLNGVSVKPLSHQYTSMNHVDLVMLLAIHAALMVLMCFLRHFPVILMAVQSSSMIALKALLVFS